MRVYLVGIAAALAAMAGWSAWQQSKGVEKERARVVAIGEKTHARAKAARKKVEAKKPEELREDLKRYCVDCGN
jgi:uncharacterized protein YdgA (DUF945 family)